MGTGRSRPTDDVIPGDVALRRGNADCSTECEEVRRSGKHGAVSLDPEHDLVALLDPQRFPHNLRHSHLPLGTHPRGRVHRLSLPNGNGKDTRSVPEGLAYWLSLIHISEPTRRTPISYAVFCLKKKNQDDS